MILARPWNIWPLILPGVVKGNKPEPTELINLIRIGVPAYSINDIAMVLEIPRSQMCKLLRMSPRTAQRGVSSKLDIDKSDHLIQIVKLIQRCVDVFGSKEKAIRWVKTPNHFLGEQSPLTLIDTTEGIDHIHDALIRLEHGIYA